MMQALTPAHFLIGDSIMSLPEPSLKDCEELNNSPQIEAAADGRPLTSYAANSSSNGAARRVWRLGWRSREFGDQGRRAREFGDQAWRMRENEDFAGKARVPCGETG